jgi:hypothetical protein
MDNPNLSGKQQEKRLFRTIRVKSNDELQRLLEHLLHEAHRAQTYWTLWGAIEQSVEEYGRELHLTPGFWEVTKRAYQDAVVLRLARLFDPHPSVISLGNLLRTIEAEKSGRGTLTLPGIVQVNLHCLEKEVLSVSVESDPVRTLLGLRDEYLAHRNVQRIKDDTLHLIRTPQKRDIDTLFRRASGILTKYRRLLSNPSPLIWGNEEAQDFNKLLECVRLSISSRTSRPKF